MVGFLLVSLFCASIILMFWGLGKWIDWHNRQHNITDEPEVTSQQLLDEITALKQELNQLKETLGRINNPSDRHL